MPQHRPQRFALGRHSALRLAAVTALGRPSPHRPSAASDACHLAQLRQVPSAHECDRQRQVGSRCCNLHRSWRHNPTEARAAVSSPGACPTPALRAALIVTSSVCTGRYRTTLNRSRHFGLTAFRLAVDSVFASARCRLNHCTRRIAVRGIPTRLHGLVTSADRRAGSASTRSSEEPSTQGRTAGARMPASPARKLRSPARLLPAAVIGSRARTRAARRFLLLEGLR